MITTHTCTRTVIQSIKVATSCIQDVNTIILNLTTYPVKCSLSWEFIPPFCFQIIPQSYNTNSTLYQPHVCHTFKQESLITDG